MYQKTWAYLLLLAIFWGCTEKIPATKKEDSTKTTKKEDNAKTTFAKFKACFDKRDFAGAAKYCSSSYAKLFMAYQKIEDTSKKLELTAEKSFGKENAKQVPGVHARVVDKFEILKVEESGEKSVATVKISSTASIYTNFSDLAGKTKSFNMVKNNKKWEVIDLPWIENIEKDLSSMQKTTSKLESIIKDIKSKKLQTADKAAEAMWGK